MIVSVNENHFREYIIHSSRKLIIAIFYAAWSKESEEMLKVVESISRKYTLLVDVLKVDVDVEKKLAMMGGVQTVPTTFIFNTGNDQPIAGFTGFVAENDLCVAIEKFLGR
jgi:thioredoxin-like negative regulator of GroEL